jgi:hypothetical protein
LAPVTSFLPDDWHVQDRALDHALEARRGLRVDLAGAGDGRACAASRSRTGLLQLVDLRGARLEDLEADGLSQRASSRCSTVMNSWRFCRASTKAM